MIWIIFIAIITGIIIIGVNTKKRNSILEKVYATSEYKRLWNLLEECTLINKDFPIIRFQIEQRDCPCGYFRFLIEFCDLGMCAILPWESTIERTEQDIKAKCKAEFAKCNINTPADAQRITDRFFRIRSDIQRDADDNFFNQLFAEHQFKSKNLVITSPFEYYASSGGSCIVDTDSWKVKGDNVVYTGLLVFENCQSKIIPYAIEKMAGELFPNAKISRYSDGCYINIPLN